MPTSEELFLSLKLKDETQGDLRKFKENTSQVLKDMERGQPYTHAISGSAPAGQRKAGTSQVKSAAEHSQDHHNYKKAKDDRKKASESKHESRKIMQETKAGLGTGEQAGSFIGHGDVVSGAHAITGAITSYQDFRARGRRNRALKSGGGVPGGVTGGVTGGVGPEGAGPSGSTKIANATITIQRATLGGPGMGGRRGGAMLGGDGAPRESFWQRTKNRVGGWFGRGPGGAAPRARAGGGSRGGFLGKAGAGLGGAAFGIGLVAGIPLMVTQAYAGYRKQFLGAQRGTLGSLGKIGISGKGLGGTMMGGSERGAAIMAAQQEVGSEFARGKKGFVGGKATGGWQQDISQSVKLAIGQGLGATAGAKMFGQVAEFGRYRKASDVNKDIGTMLGHAMQSGVGYRQRGRFIQAGIDLTARGREAGMFQETAATTRVLGGLYKQRDSITGMPQAQRVTGMLGQKMGAGLMQGSPMSALIAMQAMKEKPGMSMFEAMKESEGGLTSKNLARLKDSGMMKGDMGKMFLMTQGFKAREAEAMTEGVFGEGALKDVDKFQGGKDAVNKRTGFVSQAKADQALLWEERLGATKTAEKSLDVQMEIAKLTKHLAKGVGQVRDWIIDAAD